MSTMAMHHPKPIMSARPLVPAPALLPPTHTKFSSTVFDIENTSLAKNHDTGGLTSILMAEISLPSEPPRASTKLPLQLPTAHSTSLNHITLHKKKSQDWLTQASSPANSHMPSLKRSMESLSCVMGWQKPLPRPMYVKNMNAEEIEIWEIIGEEKWTHEKNKHEKFTRRPLTLSERANRQRIFYEERVGRGILGDEWMRKCIPRHGVK